MSADRLPADPFVTGDPRKDLREDARATWGALLAAFAERGPRTLFAALRALSRRDLDRMLVAVVLGLLRADDAPAPSGVPGFAAAVDPTLSYWAALFEAAARGEEALKTAVGALTDPEARRLVLGLALGWLGLGGTAERG